MRQKRSPIFSGASIKSHSFSVELLFLHLILSHLKPFTGLNRLYAFVLCFYSYNPSEISTYFLNTKGCILSCMYISFSLLYFVIILFYFSLLYMFFSISIYLIY